MNKQNLDKLEIETARQLAKRDRKKRKRMRVSGAGAKNLQKIILSLSKK